MSLPREDGYEMAELEILSAYKAYLNDEPADVILEHIKEMNFIMNSMGDVESIMDCLIEDIDPRVQRACMFVTGFTAGYSYKTKENK